MNDEIVELKNFVELHSYKIPSPKDERVAYLTQHSSSGIPYDTVLTRYTVEDVKSSFDTESTSVRWLLRQMMTYDVSRQSVLGLVFQKNHVLAHVIEKGSVRTEHDDSDSD